MSAKLDLENQTFGPLKVKSLNRISGTHAYWNIKCNVCGFESVKSGSNLKFYPARCKKCYQEERWVVKKPQRIQLCNDYMSGMSGNDIMEKYKIKRTTIYTVLKHHGIETDRKRK